MEGTMQRLDRNYILVGLTWVLVGMVFGTWLGASNHMNYANSHAHVGLLGFVASVLFGLLHWAYPALGKSRLAIWQFGIYEVGVLLLVIGKVLVDGGTETLFLQIGSLITIVGAALMLVMFVRHGNKSVAA
jgi:peptidoglycan/LPS O-acetylase OafA/YrhL